MDKDNELLGGGNIRTELMKLGVFCQRANNDPDLGKSRIKRALEPQYSHITRTEQPLLRISRNCRQTIYEFQHYQWDEYRRHASEKGQKNTVKKKDDHFMDCLRYIYNYDPRYINVIEDEEDEGVRYEGTYTKHPVKKAPRSSYHNLVEGR